MSDWVKRRVPYFHATNLTRIFCRHLLQVYKNKIHIILQRRFELIEQFMVTPSTTQHSYKTLGFFLERVGDLLP